MFIFNQLPVLSPEQYKREDVSFINYRVAQLTRNSNEINHIWLTEHPSYVFQWRIITSSAKPEKRIVAHKASIIEIVKITIEGAHEPLSF